MSEQGHETVNRLTEPETADPKLKKGTWPKSEGGRDVLERGGDRYKEKRRRSWWWWWWWWAHALSAGEKKERKVRKKKEAVNEQIVASRWEL